MISPRSNKHGGVGDIRTERTERETGSPPLHEHLVDRVLEVEWMVAHVQIMLQSERWQNQAVSHWKR